MRPFLISIAIFFGVTLASAQGVEQITLKNGEQKTTRTRRVTVKFLELIEDSRCPADVNCVWAGIARIKIQLRKNGKTVEFELNTNQHDKPAAFGYSVGLKTLLPRQTTTSKYSPSAYSATLTITRSSKPT